MTNISIELTALISIACAVIGVVLSNYSHKRESRKEAKDEGHNNGIILTELGYIKSGIDDVKRRQEKSEDNYVKIVSRLAAVEASAAAAHNRLDEIVPRPN